MNIDLQMIENLNKKSMKLNSERQKKLGLLEAARNNYEAAVKAYQAKYGVVLNETNLQAEYDKVLTELTEQYKRVSTLVESIENGTYKAKKEEAPVNTMGVGVSGQEASIKSGFTDVGNADNTANLQANTGQVKDQDVLQGFTQTSVGVEVKEQQKSVQDNKVFVSSFESFDTGDFGMLDDASDPSEEAFTPEGWSIQNNDIDEHFARILGKNK